MVFILALVLVMLVSACASPPPAPSQPAPPQPAPIAKPTMGQYADAGKVVFTSRCAGCHGDAGQGVRAPAIIGANANLGKYKDAQGLLNFISTVMPPNAPGSLPQQDYSQVLAFLLVQNNFTSPETPFDPNQLSSLPLTK